MQLTLVFIFFSIYSYSQVACYKSNFAPIFDGDTSDNCWKTTRWNAIGNTWIPYQNKLPSSYTTETGTQTITGNSDFSGRFKTLWNETENELYFLVEIKDDQFIDGYIFPNAGYSNFDVLEIFIDENRSGGNHLFDANGHLAANAFAYHLLVDKPVLQGVTTAMIACDLVGTSWSNYSIANYNSHFSNFIFKNAGSDTYYYEFSLKTYSASFNRTTLSGGNVLGLTIAYCENDQNDNQRDAFIGSVSVSGANNNDSYINASIFGNMTLLGINDVVAPTIPTNVTINNKIFSWSNSTDYNGIDAYEIFWNNSLVSTTGGLSHTISGLKTAGNYWFKVRSKDTQGNYSDFSDSVLINIPAPTILITGEKNESGHLTTKSFTLSGENLIDTVYIKINNNYHSNSICDGIKESNASFSTTSANFKKISIDGSILPTKFEIVPRCIIDYFCLNFSNFIVIDTLTISTTGILPLKITYISTVLTCIDNIENQPYIAIPSIYPNPTNGILNLSNKQLDHVLILDVFGKKVLEQTIENSQIDCSQIPKGVYFLSGSFKGKSSKAVKLVLD